MHFSKSLFKAVLAAAAFAIGGCAAEDTPSYWSEAEAGAKVCSDAAWRRYSQPDGKIILSDMEKLAWDRTHCLAKAHFGSDVSAAWCFYYVDGDYSEHVECIEDKTFFTANSELLAKEIGIAPLD